jgi:hypothetical protein
MTARLPVPGSDDGDWGDVLNSYLLQTHNPDGTLKAAALSTAGAAPDVAVVHKTGDETIAGVKNFTGSLQVGGQAVVAGNDSRLSDARTPADTSVTYAKLSAGTASGGDVLSYNGSGIAWAAPASAGVGYGDLPAGTTLTVTKSGGVWPARPTSRSDVIVQWKGADPSPPIVSSGTGGMLDNVDMRFVTP